ncbi:hypothetical protein DSL72_008113 [Monilinia vaccinii-corymbosi]|uniref:Uncharacterized protein n=1 Tax=Monilinia vaccinii-corymbosi TaxID=61207 RepID=A0A8A3PJT9_9HELO|nr:hypothetical protein DSL72_008113 [Monilinia vaccinii-corymbosi]
MCLFGIPKEEDIVFVDRRAPRRKSTQIVRQRRSSHSRPVSRISETVIRQQQQQQQQQHGGHRHSTSLSETHRHSSSMSEIHRGPPSRKHSPPMTEIYNASAPPTRTHAPPAPVPVPTVVATPPPPTPAGYPPRPVSSARPPQAYVPPASPRPSHRDLSPPRVPTPPDGSRIELIKVEEEHWPPHSRSRSRERSSPGASHVSRRKSSGRGSLTSGRGRDRDRGEREEIYIQRDRIIERGTPSPHPPPSPSSYVRRRGSRGSRGSGTPEPAQSGYRTVEGTGWDDRERRPITPITPSGYRVVDGAAGRKGGGLGVASLHREREWERERVVSEADFDGKRSGRKGGSSSMSENGPRNSGRLWGGGEGERKAYHR